MREKSEMNKEKLKTKMDFIAISRIIGRATMTKKHSQGGTSVSSFSIELPHPLLLTSTPGPLTYRCLEILDGFRSFHFRFLTCDDECEFLQYLGLGAFLTEISRYLVILRFLNTTNPTAPY